MAYPVVKVNNSTGSSTASGAGPGDGTTSGSVVSGTASAHTLAAASTTITFDDTPDFSNVATDGSHVLFLGVGSSSNQYTRILGKDAANYTLTVEDSFTIDDLSPVDYAIGGKVDEVETLRSEGYFFTRHRQQWTTDIEHTGTTYQVAGTIQFSTGGDSIYRHVITSSSSTRPTVRSDGTASLLRNYGGEARDGVWVSNLILDGNDKYVFYANKGHSISFFNCDLVTTNTNACYLTGNRPLEIEWRHCYFSAATSGTYRPDNSGAGATYTVQGCVFDNCAIYLGNRSSVLCSDTIVYNSPTHGIYGYGNYRNCTIVGSSGDGIRLANNAVVRNCIICGNTGYGINETVASRNSQAYNSPLVNANCFGAGSSGSLNDANGSGDLNNIIASNSISESPDFTDIANKDFTPQNSNLRNAAAFSMGGDGGSAFTSRGKHVGAIPLAESSSGGGGGSIFHPLAQ